MTYRLLDTNIVSFMIKKHTLRHLYQQHTFGYLLAVSFQTVAELEEGAVGAMWGIRRRLEMDRVLKTMLIIQSDERTIQKYADVRVARRLQPISCQDAWIAATALAAGIELITHDRDDFASIPGLAVISVSP